MYLVMADSREKIIGVSDTETGARHAGWDWLKAQYPESEWSQILEDMDYENEGDLRHDLLMGAYWEDFDMEIIEVKRV